MHTERYQALLLFVLLAAIWGSSFAVIKTGLEFFPPVLYAALRYELATLIMTIYMFVRTTRWIPENTTEWLHVAVSGVFIYAGYHALLFIGEQHTLSTVAAIIVSIIPVLTVGFARLFLPNERLRSSGLIGVGVSFLGVILVVGPDSIYAIDITRGELLIMGCAVSYALGSVFSQRYQTDLPIETQQAWAMGCGALILHVLSFSLGEPSDAIRWTVVSVGVLGYLVLMPSVIGFLLYFTLHDRLGSIEANLIAYADPVFAALFGWVLLGETIGLTTVTGFCIIFVGFVLVKSREFHQLARNHSKIADRLSS